MEVQLVATPTTKDRYGRFIFTICSHVLYEGNLVKNTSYETIQRLNIDRKYIAEDPSTVPHRICTVACKLHSSYDFTSEGIFNDNIGKPVRVTVSPRMYKVKSSGKTGISIDLIIISDKL